MYCTLERNVKKIVAVYFNELLQYHSERNARKRKILTVRICTALFQDKGLIHIHISRK